MSYRPWHGLNDICLGFLGLTPEALRSRLLRRLGRWCCSAIMWVTGGPASNAELFAQTDPLPVLLLIVRQSSLPI
jgi:hypothetical protein